MQGIHLSDFAVGIQNRQGLPSNEDELGMRDCVFVSIGRSN